jgi:hypothetical protein|tara:strand:+ start:92 stop:217 length:126 start_codon:yes stop_codon:yes gene_type:complete
MEILLDVLLIFRKAETEFVSDARTLDSIALIYRARTQRKMG